MSEAKNEDFVDVRENLDSEDEHDEEFEDALDELVRASDAAKKRNEPFQGTPKTENPLEKGLDQLGFDKLQFDELGLSNNKDNLNSKDSDKPEVLEDDDNQESKKDNEKDVVDEALNDEEESETEQEENEEDLLEERRKKEEAMSEEEITKLKAESQTLKEQGNTLFKNSELTEAVQSYTKALELCPLKFTKDRSIMYSNRAACMMHLNDNTAGIEDCTRAIELNPNYLKAILRRAELYEKTEKLDEALADYQKVVELDPRMHHAREACLRLPKQIEERNEKMKQEMMGKLKDLGNMILRPFGLSTDNFQLQQDPNSGGYSVNFQQNVPQQRPPPEPTHFPKENPSEGSTPATPPRRDNDSNKSPPVGESGDCDSNSSS